MSIKDLVLPSSDDPEVQIVYEQLYCNVDPEGSFGLDFLELAQRIVYLLRRAAKD